MNQELKQELSSKGLIRKTPIMGWASWNCFHTDISEERLKEQARALVDTGLAECGYTYLNMDDGFFGGRDEQGVLHFHKERFPNGIKPVADYAHELGLKAGIYSEAGDNTCGHYYDHEGNNGKNVGLFGHEEQDLRMYLVENGFDFIKVDWCGGVRLGLNDEEQYTKIGKIIDRIRLDTGREIVYNICRWQFPGSWAAKVADSWRTGADICPIFSSVVHQLDMIKPLARYCSPGHVNDLDMMQIGNGLTHEEEKSHFAMWCMMSTPLMIGCDLTKIKEETLAILKNEELIALNQDSACKQAYVIKEFRNENGELLGEIWLKELGEGGTEKAVAFLNRSGCRLSMELSLEEAGLLGEILEIRDLWEHTDCECKKTISVEAEPHGTLVYRIKSETGREIPNKDDKGEYHWKPIEWIDMPHMEQLVEEGALLVDVRTEQEYAQSHLSDAMNVPYMDMHAIAGNYFKDKSQPLVLYCATGKRSSQAKQSLEYLGYEKVYLLKTEGIL
ncbi:MAG: alpha-galactosidase [Lachnospiraceae bacterium]|nr:alpha-galactosidase [Lachnospiraceae bacterium]